MSLRQLKFFLDAIAGLLEAFKGFINIEPMVPKAIIFLRVCGLNFLCIFIFLKTKLSDINSKFFG